MRNIHRMKAGSVIFVMLLASMNLFAQNEKKMEKVTATELYNAFRKDSKEAAKKYGMKTMIISGVAVKVGPDVYGLPSVEVAGKAGDKCKALCVLPFTDYLKLRHVDKKDQVEMQGEIRGYTSEYDLVVVKKCKIVTVNGKEP